MSFKYIDKICEICRLGISDNDAVIGREEGKDDIIICIKCYRKHVEN